MRTDQYENFQRLSELLADELVVEANPNQWPVDEEKREKCKKNALSTLVLLTRINGLVNAVEGKRAGAIAQSHIEKEMEAEMVAVARETTKLLNRLQAGESERSN